MKDETRDGASSKHKARTIGFISIEQGSFGSLRIQGEIAQNIHLAEGETQWNAQILLVLFQKPTFPQVQSVLLFRMTAQHWFRETFTGGLTRSTVKELKFEGKKD